MTTSDLLRTLEAELAKAVEHFKHELSGLQIGRASAALVEDIQAEVYGAHQSVKNIASISVPEPKTLFIQPFDKTTLKNIEKAIQDSSLGLNPSNDGERIILNIPPMTEERRRSLAKLVGDMAENARITVRRVRQDAMNTAKRLAKEDESDVTEDQAKGFEKQAQEKVDATNKEVDEIAKKKEGDIMTV